MPAGPLSVGRAGLGGTFAAAPAAASRPPVVFDPLAT
jgi:hypothetical protein